MTNPFLNLSPKNNPLPPQSIPTIDLNTDLNSLTTETLNTQLEALNSNPTLLEKYILNTRKQISLKLKEIIALTTPNPLLENKDLINRLTALNKTLNSHLSLLTDRNREVAKRISKEGEERMNRRERSPLLSQSQYNTQKSTLIQLGLLDSNGTYTSTEGITYTYPTLQEVTKRLQAIDSKVLEKKTEQGFTRLLITPNGLPFQDYIDALKELTKKKAIKKQKPNAQGVSEVKYFLKDNLGNEIEFNPADPLYKWDGHDKTDWTTNGISEKEHTKNTNGFDICLIEQDLNLPRENTNQIIGGRTRLEANKTPQAYEDLLTEANKDSNNPNYLISGISRQEGITLYINTLNTEGVVLDNYQNTKSSSPYNLSSKNGSDVSLLYWDRDDCQWTVRGRRSSVGYGDESVRVSVRV